MPRPWPFLVDPASFCIGMANHLPSLISTSMAVLVSVVSRPFAAAVRVRVDGDSVPEVSTGLPRYRI